MTDNLKEVDMDYMIVYPLPKDYKDTLVSMQGVMEKFKKFFKTSELISSGHTLDRTYNAYKKTHKYVCLNSSMERPEYYTDMPVKGVWDNYIILHDDDNNISIGEL